MTLHVEETGTAGAPSIVFLHGVGTSGWMWWQQTADLADFHCLNVDLPGHGRSSHIPWVSLADTADQVAAAIRSRATDGKSSLVGLSLGGYVAMALLERHSALVDRAIISGVTAAPMPNRIWLNPQAWLMTLLKRRWLLQRQAKSMNLPPKAQAAYTENLLAMSMRTYRSIAEEIVTFRVPAMLAQSTIPTLVVAGGAETGIIRDTVTEISSLMPHAKGLLAPGLGHGWNVAAPGLFNAMVRAWMTDTPLPDELKLARRPASLRAH